MALKSSKTQKTARAEVGSIGLTGVDFQDQICSLWKHSRGKPKGPIVYAVPPRRERDNTGFPLEIEIELAEGIAYIAAVKKGVESVSASAVGLPNDPHDGLLLHIASNDGVRSDVQEHLQSIILLIQGIASRGECRLVS